LSLESQASSLAAVALAPLVGLAADAASGTRGAPDGLWAVAAIAVLVAVGPAARALTRRRQIAVG
jgi:hypothetical protein